ncbi:MAG: tetratricopeptide repeat protein [Chthoniobacterales bacterium]|nr:tetratricopeptide repeat protein [Chthoniobacterales bacterium]
MWHKRHTCFKFLFLFSVFLFFLRSAIASNSNDPAQEFLIAYQNFQQAERLERSGKEAEAIDKYRYAEDILKALSNNNPDWQQPVVDYRLHKVRDSLARLNSTLPPKPLENEDSYEKTVSHEMPVNNKLSHEEPSPKEVDHKLEERPSISITPPLTKKNISDPQITQLQQQLKKTELELQKVQQDLHDKTIELDHSKIVIVDMKSQLEKTERQVTDLRNDLSKVHLRGAKREELLQQSVRTLEGKVNDLAADQEIVLEENKQLQDHLNRAAASLVAAVGAKQQLEELQVEVNKEKNNAALLHQKLLISQNEHNATNELNSTLKKQLLEANVSLSQAEKQAKEATLLRLQIDNLRADDAALQAQIVTMKKDQQGSSNRFKEEAQATQHAYQVLETKKLDIEKKLSVANEKIKLFEESSSRQAAVQEEIALYKKQLQESSLKLMEQQKKITELEKAEPEKDHLLIMKEKELTSVRLDSEKLQKELASATEKLSLLQAEVQLKDSHYSELKNQLDKKNEELLAMNKKEDLHQPQENAIAENQLLRGIVIRELKAEAKRLQIKKLITEDLEKLKVNSVTLSNELKKLARPIKLTPEEKSLFKDMPVLPVNTEEENDDLLVLSTAASKKEDHPSDKGEVVNSHNASQAPPNNMEHPLHDNPLVDIKNSAEASRKHRELIKAAKEQFESHNYLEAEKNFQAAVALSPNDYLTLSNLGVVQFQLGKMAEAESVLKKAVSIDPKKSFPLTTLGIVQYRQEKMNDAEKNLRQAIAINDQDFTAHNYLGIVLAASGKGKSGEGEILKALEINPQYADAHFNLAVIYATSKPPAKEMAKTHYQKAIKLGAPVDASLEKLLN